MASNDNKLPSPFNGKPFTDLFSIFDQWFEDPLGIFDHQIKVDMYEREDAVVIEADVPGVTKEQIQLEWLADGLKLSVENRTELKETNEKERYYRKERSLYRKERFIPLGLVPSPKNIKAKYENGIVVITIPKYNIKQSHHQIIDID